MQAEWSLSAVIKINHCLLSDHWRTMKSCQVTDKQQGNCFSSVSSKATFRLGKIQSLPPPQKKKKHREHVEQAAEKLKQSNHYRSYSAPPGVSWPLGNFLLNYTACCHLWSIMVLSPSALCCWDVKANSYRSNHSAIPFRGRESCRSYYD